jgi:hypothetical protein
MIEDTYTPPRRAQNGPRAVTLTTLEGNYICDALRRAAAEMLQQAATLAAAGDHCRAELEALAAIDRYRSASKAAEAFRD